MFIGELHAHVYAKDDASMFMQEFTCGIWLAKITFTAFKTQRKASWLFQTFNLLTIRRN